jgi:hypothetical protein
VRERAAGSPRTGADHGMNRVLSEFSPETGSLRILRKRHEKMDEKEEECNEYQLTVRRYRKRLFIEERVYDYQGLW